MQGDTQKGFGFGDWQAFPLRNLLVGPPGEIHIEPKVMQVLQQLAGNPGQVVEREKLLNDIWDGRAFSDEPLTRCIAALRHALGDSPTDPKYIQTIPKSGYRLVCPVESLEHATNDSKLDVDEPSVTRKGSVLTGRRRIALPAFLGLILFAALFVAYRSTLIRPTEAPQLSVEGTTQSEPPVYSIAVLPFINLSSDPEQEYFSDGISEELLNVLSKIPGLHVAARASSFQFKGENRNIIDIGQQLNVAHVLEGSVRKADLQVRISAQLIDARSGFHVWSDTYDRELENIFAVQDEISAAIVGALEEHLKLQIEAAPRVIATADTEAHEAYLRGRHLAKTFETFDRVNIEGAVREFEKAIALDPDYALAHAELALAIVSLSRKDSGNLTDAEVRARAAPHAERAIALDPTLAEAHAAIGLVLWLQWNFEEARTHFEQALQINPNLAWIYDSLGVLLFEQLGQYKEGYAMSEMAVRLDPMNGWIKLDHIMFLIALNRLAEADRELEKFASVDPARYASLRGYLTSLDGKWANAVLANLDSLQIQPVYFPGRRMLSFYFAIIGLEKEALAITQSHPPYQPGRPGDTVAGAETRVAEDPDDLRARRQLGLALAAAGDYTGARPFLEEMWQRSGGRIARWGMFPTPSAAALIAIRRDAGEEAGVAELVAAIRDNVRRYRETGTIRVYGLFHSVDFEEGLADYLAGEREKGLALIAKAAEDGHFTPLGLAYLQVLYDDPGFAPIRASQEARQARERERFLDIVCTDNPYLAVWQPEEGTCERFAATGGN